MHLEAAVDIGKHEHASVADATTTKDIPTPETFYDYSVWTRHVYKVERDNEGNVTGEVLIRGYYYSVVPVPGTEEHVKWMIVPDHSEHLP